MRNPRAETFKPGKLVMRSLLASGVRPPVLMLPDATASAASRTHEVRHDAIVQACQTQSAVRDVPKAEAFTSDVPILNAEIAPLQHNNYKVHAVEG
jgi:hypothetical protein